MEAEVWLDPLGRPAHLTFLGSPEAAFPELTADEDYEPWFPEGPGQRPPVVYELRNAANPRLRLTRTVFPLEPWSPYDAITDILVREGWTPPAQEDA
jgi:hypothetical protein